MTSHTATVAELTSDAGAADLARHIITFDPREPARYLFAANAGSPEAVELAARLTPDPIPWPAGLAPTPRTIDPAPADTDPLPAGDVLVVTYTVAEAYALADVLTPGVDTTAWTPYRNGWTALRALITGHRAPALELNRAGLWHTTTIGDTRVVVVKSDLHPATDGVHLPIRTLWKQLVDQVRPRLVITTGTAGGVQADTALGDVVLARTVRWDCTHTFAHAAFAHDTYTSPLRLHPGELTTATHRLLPVNAVHVPDGNHTPRVWVDAPAHRAQAVSTDFFAFDDTEDHYGLRAYDPHARAVEMDDAALGLACTDLTDPPPWVSIRNASDPQMTGTDLTTQKTQAAAIYEKYGYWTTIASAITCWAVIAHSLPTPDG